MPFKRKIVRRKVIVRGKKIFPKTRKRAGVTLRGLAKRMKLMTKTIETKSGVRQITDGTEYLHNTLYIVNNTFMQTGQGLQDSESTTGNRIGDQISLVGVSFKMMLELNERYSDVTFGLFVIRSAKGDTPTTATLWQGASGNKMLDTFNTERFSVLHSQYVKLTARNQGNTPNLIQEVGSGYQVGPNVISRAKKSSNSLCQARNSHAVASFSMKRNSHAVASFSIQIQFSGLVLKVMIEHQHLIQYNKI